MNNSIIQDENIESPVDVKQIWRQREQELLEIIEAIDAVSASNYWKLLQQKVFNGVVDSLQRRIRNEKDTIELFRLQGQITWAEKYSEFHKLADGYRRELLTIRNKLQ